jgi:CheY-like chemotaxis protein
MPDNIPVPRKAPLILVVDDEEDFLEIVSAPLKAAGFTVAVAHNGEEAKKQAETLQPDLILMDIYMPPGPTGTEVALSMKQNAKTKDLRIAFLTSLRDPWPGVVGDNRSMSKELGMEDFIEKTGDPKALVARVKSIVGVQ